MLTFLLREGVDRVIGVIDRWVSKKIMANGLNAEGVNYSQGINGYSENLQEARSCFESALAFNPDHIEAKCHLGEMYFLGQGVAQDYARAKRYYTMAANEGSKEAKRQLLRIELAEQGYQETADSWNALGTQYLQGENGKDQDAAKACLCYKEALRLDGNHQSTYYNLGLSYDLISQRRTLFNLFLVNSSALFKKRTKAEQYYIKAALLGHEEAKHQLLKIEIARQPSEETANLWNTLGTYYHQGTNGRVQDHVKARLCYKEALWLDKNHQCAHYNLGLIYHFGLGIHHDLDKATQAYRKAALQGDENARRQLLQIEFEKHQCLTAEDWVILGNQYKHGSEGYPHDWVNARLCFVKALGLDANNQHAHFNLGIIYEEGLGADKDVNKAREHYLKAADQNHRLAKRRLEKITIEKLLSNNDLNKKDDAGNTALHRAAKNKWYKYYARLLFLGADSLVKNAGGHQPEYYLKEVDQKTRCTTSLSLLTKTRDHYQSKAPETIKGKIRCMGQELDKERTQTTLETLYQDSYIKPLLEVVKFALRAQHDLSKRPHFTDEDYCSDDDDQLKKEVSFSFRITMDANRETLEGIYCGDGADAVGIYHKNAIGVGGARFAKGLVKGTFIHEITHFVADEVFKNNSAPYRSRDDKTRMYFNEMSQRLQQHKDSLPPRIQEAFSNNYVNANQVHSELIVRVIQLYSENGLKIVKENVPELWNYYKNIFLSEVKSHVAKLDRRMRSGWSPKLFTQTSDKTFHFQHAEANLGNQSSMKLK